MEKHVSDKTVEALARRLKVVKDVGPVHRCGNCSSQITKSRGCGSFGGSPAKDRGHLANEHHFGWCGCVSLSIISPSAIRLFDPTGTRHARSAGP
jgi:hypothetical protein